MALGSTQPLTEMSTRNLLGGIGCGPARKADLKMLELRRLTAIWASTACYTNSVDFYIQKEMKIWFVTAKLLY
jgi:hypothetical protein